MLARSTRSSGERRTHSSEWEGTQTCRRERHAHRWPSMVRGAMLAWQTRSSGEWRTHSSEWEGTQMLRRERHAHRCPSMVRGAMLAPPTRSATYHRALGSGELIPQNERKLRRSEGSGMEGSNASSTTVPWWPRRLSQRPTTWLYDPGLRSLEQGSHPSLDLVSTSEVITAIADSL